MLRQSIVIVFVIASATLVALWWGSHRAVVHGKTAGVRVSMDVSAYTIDCWARNGIAYFTIDRCPMCLQSGTAHGPQCKGARWFPGYGVPARDFWHGPFRWKTWNTTVSPMPQYLGSISPAPPASTWTTHAVWVPIWALLLVLLLYPSVAGLLGPIRRAYRRRAGRCVKCAYDLTGLPSPRCPECGTQIIGWSQLAARPSSQAGQ